MADYDRLRRALGDRGLPAAFVDLDALEDNADRLCGLARSRGKTIRLATKSIRCLALIQRLLARHPDVMRGLMCFSAREAEALHSRGFDDLLVAYPSAHPDAASRLARLTRAGATVSIAVDDEAQLRVLAATGAPIRVVIDLDVSYRIAGAHLGVRRSPLVTVDAAVALAARVVHHGLPLHGLLAYEAHIAGLPDRSAHRPWLNRPKRALKRLSRPRVEAARRELRARLEAAGHTLAVVNGGGSGSLAWCTEEPALTEVTAGSGFLDSHLFDDYQDLDVRPAAFFALEASRRPAPGLVTCHGGGYVASGAVGADRLPIPWLPRGLALLGQEGAGEVQTPLAGTAADAIALGDPVIFRHAKAGELAEHFTHYLLIRGGAVEAEVETYRGEGWQFP